MVEPSNLMLSLQVFYWEHLLTCYNYLTIPNNSHCEEKERLYIILTG